MRKDSSVGNNVKRAFKIFGLDLRSDMQAVIHLANDLEFIFEHEEDDLGLLSYYEVRQMVFSWLAKHGEDEKRFGGKPTKKGNAFYYYKQAMRYGDLEAAQKYLKKYYTIGGAKKLPLKSVRYAHPLSSIPGMKRIDFRQSLTTSQEKLFKAALKWYRRK